MPTTLGEKAPVHPSPFSHGANTNVLRDSRPSTPTQRVSRRYLDLHQPAECWIAVAHNDLLKVRSDRGPAGHLVIALLGEDESRLRGARDQDDLPGRAATGYLAKSRGSVLQ